MKEFYTFLGTLFVLLNIFLALFKIIDDAMISFIQIIMLILSILFIVYLICIKKNDYYKFAFEKRIKYFFNTLSLINLKASYYFEYKETMLVVKKNKQVEIHEIRKLIPKVTDLVCFKGLISKSENNKDLKYEVSAPCTFRKSFVENGYNKYIISFDTPKINSPVDINVQIKNFICKDPQTTLTSLVDEKTKLMKLRIKFEDNVDFPNTVKLTIYNQPTSDTPYYVEEYPSNEKLRKLTRDFEQRELVITDKKPIQGFKYKIEWNTIDNDDVSI